MSYDDIMCPVDLSDPYLAKYQQNVIIEHIKDYQNSLDEQHEVGVFLANFGSQKTMTVTSIGFSNPMLITFYGYVDNVESVLIQHISQINFLLTSVKKPAPNKPARRIGFTLNHD